MPFKLVAPYQPAGDQPAAIRELTDGIQKMVDWNLSVYTTKVASSEIWLDIGSPDLYWEAQNLSHKYYSHERVP